LKKKKCMGCGIEIQVRDEKKPGFVPERVAMEKGKVICKRCFRIKNYGENNSIQLSHEEYKTEVTKVLKEVDVVLYVIDIIDFEGSFDDTILELIKKKKVTNVDTVEEVLDIIRENPDYDVIGIDELQFLKGDPTEAILKMLRMDKRVLCTGLDMDFKGVPFGVIPNIMALANDVTKLTAICVKCGNPANMTQRVIDGKEARIDDPLILVGETDSYEARCRKCHKVLPSLSQLSLY